MCISWEDRLLPFYVLCNGVILPPPQKEKEPLCYIDCLLVLNH